MKYLYILLFSLVQYSSYSQSCLPDGILFTSQNEVDAFIIDYPNCTEIEGNVTIVGVDISDLSPFANLLKIGGDLLVGSYFIGNEVLLNLDGLQNIDSVLGDIMIWNNPLLESVAPLSPVHVTTIDIMNNTSLNDLTSLSSFTSIKDDFLLVNNVAIESLNGMDNISNIGGVLSISHNLLLTDFNHLQSLESIGGTLVIQGQSSIEDLTFFRIY